MHAIHIVAVLKATGEGTENLETFFEKKWRIVMAV
jgi:hypothetical protein